MDQPSVPIGCVLDHDLAHDFIGIDGTCTFFTGAVYHRDDLIWGPKTSHVWNATSWWEGLYAFSQMTVGVVVGWASNGLVGLTSLFGQSRRLDGYELSRMSEVFGDRIDWSRVRIRKAGPLAAWFLRSSDTLAFITGYQITAIGGVLDMPSLFHELVHILQYQTYGNAPVWDSVFSNTNDALTAIDQQTPWEQLHHRLEVQAALAEQAFKRGLFRATEAELDTAGYLGTVVRSFREQYGLPGPPSGGGLMVAGPDLFAFLRILLPIGLLVVLAGSPVHAHEGEHSPTESQSHRSTDDDSRWGREFSSVSHWLGFRGDLGRRTGVVGISYRGGADLLVTSRHSGLINSRRVGVDLTLRRSGPHWGWGVDGNVQLGYRGFVFETGGGSDFQRRLSRSPQRGLLLLDMDGVAPAWVSIQATHPDGPPP